VVDGDVHDTLRADRAKSAVLDARDGGVHPWAAPSTYNEEAKMRRVGIVGTAIVFSALAGCASMQGGPTGASHGSSPGGWISLLDGTSLSNWNQVGDANWRVARGEVIADKGNGFLVTKTAYGDFELRAEFYAESDTNSGIYIRCQDPQKLGTASCYEVNIWDDRPKPEYGTGAIVDVAKVDPMPKAAGRWNTYHVTAKGNHMVVVMNGKKTAEGRDAKFARGVIGLQHGAGVKNDLSPIKFRKVEIRPL
jgi:hypothetical protein